MDPFSFKSCQLIGAPANYSPPRFNMPPGVPKARHIVACVNRRVAGVPEGNSCNEHNGECLKNLGIY